MKDRLPDSVTASVCGANPSPYRGSGGRDTRTNDHSSRPAHDTARLPGPLVEAAMVAATIPYTGTKYPQPRQRVFTWEKIVPNDLADELDELLALVSLPLAVIDAC